MQDLFLQNYEWLRALHIIAVISWMAGLLYLPRLFVYHADVDVGSDISETFKIMEWRLLKYIMNPAMIASWVLGLLMIYANPGMFADGWIHVKLLLVFILSGAHGALSKQVKVFKRDENDKSAKYFRILNEVPTALMIGIVILAVVQPF